MKFALASCVLACTASCALVESALRPSKRADALEPNPAPPTSVPSAVKLELTQHPSGKPWSVEADRGHPVLLDVWATWCEPCRDALPLYQALQARFAAQGLRVYAVNVDEDPSLVNGFLEEMKVTLPVLRDPSGRTLEQTLHLQIIPTAYLIDATGVVRHVQEGFTEEAEATLERQIEALVAPK